MVPEKNHRNLVRMYSGEFICGGNGVNVLCINQISVYIQSRYKLSENLLTGQFAFLKSRSRPKIGNNDHGDTHVHRNGQFNNRLSDQQTEETKWSSRPNRLRWGNSIMRCFLNQKHQRNSKSNWTEDPKPRMKSLCQLNNPNMEN